MKLDSSFFEEREREKVCVCEREGGRERERERDDWNTKQMQKLRRKLLKDIL